METTPKKWRWGVNRWIVLACIILGVFAVNIAAPVRPHIQVAPEKLIEEPLFHLGPLGDFYLVNTLPALLIVDLIVLWIAWSVQRTVRKGDLVPRGIAGALEALIEILYNLTESSAGRWAKEIFPWFASIFLVVLIANLMKLVPGVETIGIIHHAEKDGHAIQALGGVWYTLSTEKGEYTLTPFVRGLSTDLNFTVGLALISVFMTQVIGVRAQGWRYFLKFFNVTTLFSRPFFGAIDFLVGLLETISELAKILSFSFRLFGNMFAGFVLIALVGSLLPVFIPSFVYVFEAFIALIQAFVFGMLTMVFMAQATRGHGGEGEHH
ncbi:F0F1 ATP synthase subunit A [Thermanaerothrix sp. 4228-RoL]|uniref:ATP synthase subunit a n=1 Tax=Thermanaerothrix solaris TaxID=3058434 RepID=A0ABU3NQW4_9CHLR|nr:F0F1 ATP synthase subunit A [Thermanaerothrix sp. 4228-RoL]MDT8899233.1 F0F1 ATP synthase subunit A [Thermanaerothrix sp. 4228-RoL]